VRKGYFAMATEQCVQAAAMACKLVTGKRSGSVIQNFARAISDPKRIKEKQLDSNN